MGPANTARETLDRPGCVIARDMARFVRQTQRMLFHRVIETRSLHAVPQISLGFTALGQSQAASRTTAGGRGDC